MHMSVALGLGVPSGPPGPAIGADAVKLARAAERAGFHGVYVTDHPVPHPSYFGHGGHHTFDPFALLGFVAAAATTLRLQTHLVVLPYRNPLLLAKQAATVDCLSGGRLTLGVGVGYMEPEFLALGVAFEERNDLTDEAIRLLRTAWSGRPFDFEGRHFVVRGNEALPTPVQERVPIWVGGNTPRAIRRAVELGDGWIPFPHRPKNDGRFERHSDPLVTLDDLRRKIDQVRHHASAVGRRAPLEIAYMPGAEGFLDGRTPSTDEIIETSARLAEVGVTYLMATVSDRDVAARVDAFERYGAEVLPIVRALSA
jgi:probable F420-dependent oxidoreductase